MNNLSLPLKIAFLVFAIALIIAAVSFNLGKRKIFFIALIVVVISAIAMVVINKKQN